MSLIRNACSHNALFVVFKFHDEWLDVLALCLPLANALLGIGVKVLLLLVQQGLGLGCGVLIGDELLDLLGVLLLVLVLDEVGELNHACAVLLLLLLLSQCKLVVADPPELGELHLFLLCL
jgi:hypothetical protein